MPLQYEVWHINHTIYSAIYQHFVRLKGWGPDPLDLPPLDLPLHTMNKSSDFHACMHSSGIIVMRYNLCMHALFSLLKHVLVRWILWILTLEKPLLV